METSSDHPTAGEIGKAWFERVWGKRDRSAIFELLAEDALGHLEGGEETRGAERFAEFHDVLTTTFPDSELKIHRVLEQGAEVCVHWQFSGTHRGDALGIPATGEPVSFDGMTWFIVEGGKIVEGWDTWNQGRLFASLGAPIGMIRSE